MTTDRALERMKAHHAAILAIMQDAESMLTDPQTRDVAGLALARWALMRELVAYQLLKHAVMDPVVAHGAPRDAALARRLKQAGEGAVDGFRDNVRRWSSTDVVAVWATYQASALAMIARLRAMVARDGQELATLGAIRRPAAAPPRPDRPTPAG